MRILYICPDPGISIDIDGGAGTHVLETIHALRKIGHEVHVLAASGVSSPHDISRVSRHLWFNNFLNLLNRNTQTDPAKRMPPASLRQTDKNNTHAITQSRSKIRKKLRPFTNFFYGAFHHHVNLLEESTAYKKRFFNAAVKSIQDLQPDGVFERYALGHHSIANYCKKHNLPYILEVNALLAEESVHQRKWVLLFKSRQKWLELKFLNNCPRVVVVSEALKQSISPFNPRIIVLPNGVDIDRFHPKIDPTPTLERLGLNKGSIVGWIGGFGPSRGLESVVSIALATHQINPDIHFLIVGDGPLMPWARKTIQKNGLEKTIHLTGRVPHSEIPEIIAALDIALAPYPIEGASYFSPLKIFEYMAAGRTIIATRAGQSIELLTDGAGVLLNPMQPPDWAKQIQILLRDPEKRERMGTIARKRVVDNYTWTANARKIISLFELCG